MEACYPDFKGRISLLMFVIVLILGVLLASPAAASPQGAEVASVVGQAVIVGANNERFGASGTEIELQSVALDEGDVPPAATTITNELGIFQFANVAAGCYIAAGRAPGMSGQSEIFCLPADVMPLRLRIEMQVEAVVETVEVTASAITIDPTTTSSSGSVGVSTLDNAPKANRSVEDVMPLIPGVLRGKAGEINMNGVRASQSGSRLNNVDITDPVTRTSEIGLPLTVISNVEVLSTPYDAQYGGFAGAMATVDTKPADMSKFKVDVQNFTPRVRRRDGAIMGIESSTPRLTLNIPILKGRFGLLHSTEYQFVRADQEDANLPLLERDIEREALTVFNQFDARLSDRNRASLVVVVYPEKLNYFGLNAFTPQPSIPDLRRRGTLLVLRDSHEFESGGLLLTNISYQDLDSDVKPRTFEPSLMGLDRASGAFFNRQRRNTIRRKISEQYHFAPITSAGKHQLKTGFAAGSESYDGLQTFNPVTWLGTADRPVSELSFTPPVAPRASSNDAAFFLQDKWFVNEELTLDLGARLERDSIGKQWNPSYRAGFAYAFGGGSRTVMRGGAGLFIDRISLLVPTFEQLPQRIETSFGVDVEVTSARHFTPRIDGRIRNAKSLGWNLQLDHEVLNNLFLRVGYQQRRTTRNFLIEPVHGDGMSSVLTLSNSGRDQYREYQTTVRYRLRGTGHITASYVGSSSVGDLNDLGSIYGPTPEALIRPNERGPLPFDVPHRLLTWTELPMPWGFTAIPVWEIRSGFPHSRVDEERNFVGARNRAGRFPVFNSLDLQITKKISFRFKGKNRRFRAGLRLFNLLNSFNPQDVQENLASPSYGTFYRGVKRKIRAVFEIGN
ncbi:MAG: TonB-dependent receptor [Acidobacteria bacterium]|nr:TonB-dependent receptor [Acidobacteriota bacterium]